MPMYRKVNTDFFKTWSPDMAYVLGFFGADGNMICGPRGNHYFSFCSTDKDILIQIRKAMDSEHKVAKRQFKKRKKMKHWKTSYQIQIGSKEMFEDLQQLGMTPRKSLNLSFPNVPKEVPSHFVRGYFDGDGHVSITTYQRSDTKSKNYRTVMSSGFTSGSRVFLSSLHQHLKKNARIRGGSILFSAPVWRLRLSQIDSLRLYNYMYNGLANGLFLKRKKDRFKSFKSDRFEGL